MALSPTIPTSFVPKQPVSSGPKRPRNAGVNYFLLAGTIIGVGAVIAAGAVFGYSVYLGSIEKEKGAELVAAQQSLNQNRVAEFVRLRNRLMAAKTIVNEHVALSQFFAFLESSTVTDVSFSELTVSVADDRTATLTLTGTARNFNALASESNVFASNKYIKSAIFSGITLNSNNSVAFTITASIAPELVLQNATSNAAPVILPATSTAPTAVPNVSALSTTTSVQTHTATSSVPGNQAAGTSTTP